MRTVEGAGRTRGENEPMTVRGAWPSHESRREPTGRVHDPQSAGPTVSGSVAGARNPSARVGAPTASPTAKCTTPRTGGATWKKRALPATWSAWPSHKRHAYWGSGPDGTATTGTQRAGKDAEGGGQGREGAEGRGSEGEKKAAQRKRDDGEGRARTEHQRRKGARRKAQGHLGAGGGPPATTQPSSQ